MNVHKLKNFRIIIIITTFLLAFLHICIGNQPRLQANAALNSTSFNYNGEPCWYWLLGNIYNNDTGEVSYCIDQMKSDPNDSPSYTYSRHLDKNDPINYVLYNGYPRTNTIGGVSFPNDKAQAATVLAIWMLRGTTGYDGSYQSKSTKEWTNWKNPNGNFGSGLQSQATIIVDAAARLANDAKNNAGSVPACAALYEPSNASCQQIVMFMILNGSLDLQKASDNAAVTNGNGNYSLAGATYGLWNDDCSGTGRSFVTDSNGYAKIDGLDAGWYWVHEITAPKGYQLDTTHGQNGNAVGYNDNGWYHVEVVAGENRRVNGNVVYDTPRIGKIAVQKKDIVTDSAVSKAGFKFRLLASDKSTIVRDELISDDNGQVTFDNLGFGAYYVQETAAVSPFALNNEPVAVSVSDDGSSSAKTFVTSISDKMCYGNAEIKKIDNVKSSLVPGVGYNVVAQEDIEHPDGTIMYHEGDIVQHLVTGEDGTATTKDGAEDNRLYIGADGDGQYAFVETDVPAPLTINKTPIPFTIAYAGDHAEKIDTVHATQVNNVAYGSASITKTDNVLNEAIPNTTYDVTATKDIKLWNGTIIYKKGEKVDSLITDENGKAKTTTRLYVGTDGTGDYALTETSVPTGATIKTDPIAFTITYQDENVEVLGNTELTQVNNIVYGSAQISKTDNVISSNVPYAEFDVIATEDITLWNGHRIYKKNQIIEHVITGQDGIAKTRKRLYIGSDGDGEYEFVETAVKAPLLLDTTPIPFTITYEDNNTENVGCMNVQKSNTVPYTTPSLTKTDNVLNSGVPGVEYDIKAAENINLWNGTIYKKGQIIEHVVTDSDGIAHGTKPYYPGITGIGRYEFIETKVPTGLTIDKTPIPFTVKYKNQNDANLDSPGVTQTNNVVYGSASIKKTETTNGTNIAGAEFDVVATKDIELWNGNKVYKNGQVVDHIKTASDGIAMTSKPLYIGSDGEGTYKFVETFTPCPYFNDRVDVPFSISYIDDRTENVQIEKTAQKNKDNDVQTVRIKFNKTDFSNDAPVNGAVFELSSNSDIKTQSGSVIYKKDQVIGTYTTDSSGQFNVDTNVVKVDASGSCSYKFVEVKAPKGYVIDSTPAEFTVTYEGQNIKIQDNKTVSIKNKPNTFKLMKSVMSKDMNTDVTDTTVPNATFRLWNKSDELPVSVTDGSDSYALRIDNGNMAHEVTVAQTTDKAQAVLAKDSADGYAIVLTDEKGNINEIKGTSAIDLSPARYTVSIIDSKGVNVDSFDGDKHIDLKSGKNAVYAVTIDDESGEAKVAEKTENIEDVTADVKKENGAYIATGLVLDTDYQVEVDGNVVYTFKTSDEGGKTYYGRYSTTATVYPYKRQPMLLTSDSKFIDKFTINGKDYPVQTKVDTNGEINFTHIIPGSYGIGETDVPALGDKLPETDQSYLINTDICYFKVDETTGRINDVNDFQTSTEDDYTVVTLSKVEVTGGAEIPGAELEVQKPNGDVIDSWTSSDTPHVIARLAPGEYAFVEKMTPNRYDQATRVEFEIKDTGEVQHVEMVDSPIEINARLDKRQEIAKPIVAETSPNGDGKNKANTNDNANGEFEYSLDYKSTSNTWTDEFTVYDSLDGVNDGLARLDYVVTAQSSKDFDGKLNVWYQTNKTPADYNDDAAKANATVDDGHENPWITGDTRGEDSQKNDPDGDGRIIDYTGWRLWAKDVSTLAASKLNVSDLNLDEDEYVTAFRFEYGRVDKGFTTRISAWDRDDLKDEHDDLDVVAYVRSESFIEPSFDVKRSILSALMRSMDKPDDDVTDNNDDSDNANADTGETAPDEAELLEKRITEAIDSGDENALNALIPSVKNLVTMNIDTFLSSIDPSNIDEVEDTIEKTSSAYDKFSSIMSESDKKKVDSSFEQVKKDIQSNDGDNDEQIANLSFDVKELAVAIDAAIEAIDVRGNDTSVKYSPVIIGMHVTDQYVPGTNLTNSAYVDAYRNGSGDNLQGHDNDKVTQTPKQELLSSINNDLVQTGYEYINLFIIFCSSTIVFSLLLLAIHRKIG